MRRSTALSFKIINIFLIIKKIKGRFFNYKEDPNQSTATKTLVGSKVTVPIHLMRLKRVNLTENIIRIIVVNTVPVPAETGDISRSVSWTGTEEVSSRTGSNLGQFRPIRSISPVPGGTQHAACAGTGHGQAHVEEHESSISPNARNQERAKPLKI